MLEIAGLGKACEIARRDLEKNRKHLEETRDRLHEGLREKVKDIRLNGHPERRLPNTLSLGFRGFAANRLLSGIETRVAASAGAACHSGGDEISAALRAMRVPAEWARGTLRFSTGRTTTASEVDAAVEIIAEAAAELKNG